jgi:hypothetical protein
MSSLSHFCIADPTILVKSVLQLRTIGRVIRLLELFDKIKLTEPQSLVQTGISTCITA